MKASFIVIMVLAFALATEGATRFNDQRCYDEKAACASSELRKLCPYTRWHCRELGHEVTNDTEYQHITGECDKRGPADFCKSAEKAEECKADKAFCNSVGYWHF
ncbi:hypothetical protein BIW11_05581 [Tropilaelaps mercedesae]|uniref:Uncharacterized protein n=1 Tax=Tropilaelaps mercedesae TaxID=418985 RepID=A0A1V9Y1R9_9ACAR|nr:hypothetical protein BIW11_05581 [Tropilaelaps mercedesae]